MKAEKGARRERWLAFAYCLLTALGCLLICSKSSPLYPINDWTDANIYFSMGKGMANGRMIYQELYDHKGPLLYALHALCYLVSPLSFLGVWCMEVLAGAFLLFGTWKLLTLYGAKNTAYFALPVLGMLVFASVSFQQGDSAEELCLPLLMCSLHAWLSHLKEGVLRPMGPKTLLLHGVLSGCVLWTKFTMLGFYAAWILLACLGARRRWKDVWLTLGWFAAGIALATLPWILYFGLGGALLPWLKTYLYDNLFLYAGEKGSVMTWGKTVLKSIWEWFGQNLPYTLPLALGLIWTLARTRTTKIERLSPWLLFGGTTLGVFIGGKSYPYYGLILAVFAGMGFVPLCLLLERRFQGVLPEQRIRVALMATVCVASFAGCLRLSPNVRTSFLAPRARAMQYQFAAIIAETPGATLLNFGFMDAGFYTATGITPNVKYFHQTNVPLQEMREEQKRYMSEGICDYVVTRGRAPEDIVTQYELVAQAEAPEEFWYSQVYLYRLKGTAK